MRRLVTLAVILLMLGGSVGPVVAQVPAAQKQEQTKEQIVYVTRSGKRYHRESCRHLSRSKIPMTLQEAKKRGYTPCGVCKPTR